jgi:hypothetical protein
LKESPGKVIPQLRDVACLNLVRLITTSVRLRAQSHSSG